MKHVLILRALGCVLVIALAVNITAVLAAPLYLNSGEEVAQTSSTDKQPEPPTDPTPAPEVIVIDGDVVQSDSDPDADDPVETVEPDKLDADDLETVDDSEEPSSKPALAAIVEQEGAQVFFDLGVQIGSRSQQQRPIAAALKRFLRRRSTATVDDTDNDLLPTVVIVSPDQELPDTTATPNTPDNVNEDPPESTPVVVERIVLENPVENGYTVHFQLDGTVQTLKPGAMLIETSSQSVIRFDRGGSFGEFREEIDAGQYHFRVTREGWKLEKAKEDAASL